MVHNYVPRFNYNQNQLEGYFCNLMLSQQNLGVILENISDFKINKKYDSGNRK